MKMAVMLRDALADNISKTDRIQLNFQCEILIRSQIESEINRVNFTAIKTMKLDTKREEK